MGNNVISSKHLKIKVCCCNFLKWVSLYLRPNWRKPKCWPKVIQFLCSISPLLLAKQQKSHFSLLFPPFSKRNIRVITGRTTLTRIDKNYEECCV